MDITEFSRLNYSVGTINNLLKKAENSITLDEAKDAATTLIAASLVSINNRLQQLELDVAALQEAAKNDVPDEPVQEPEQEPEDTAGEENNTDIPTEGSESESETTDPGELIEPNEPSSEEDEDTENSDTSEEV